MGPRATRPDDVHTLYSGKSVRILLIAVAVVVGCACSGIDILHEGFLRKLQSM